MKNKGFVFTLDVLFAVVLLSVGLIIISYEMKSPTEVSLLLKTGEDFLMSLDKVGVLRSLDSMSQQQAEQTLDTYLSSLPPQFTANMTVKIYEYVSDDFSLKKTISRSTGAYTGISRERVTVRRSFADFRRGYFGIAYLDIWYE